MLNIRVFAPQDNNKREEGISNNNNVITVIKKKLPTIHTRVRSIVTTDFVFLCTRVQHNYN